jgi:glycosyltransferase involved in cell wall biosynthesis
MLPRPSDKLLAADIEATAHLVRQWRPAVLHAHSKYVNAQIALAMRDRYGLPVVYEVRGFLEETWRSRGRDPHSDSYQFSRAIESECMSAADAIVTISEGMKDEIISRGVPAERITVIPNGVDDSFLAGAHDGERIRQKLGVDPEELLVGVVTTLNQYEGIDVLIDAVADLRRDRVPTRLLVVGDGPERLALAEHAERRGLNGSATFTGRVPFDTVHAYHAAIDVFCVPRRDTPVTRLVTPLKPLEAMATGRPVVASDLPPLREIVRHEQTGALVAPEDPDALAEALQRFASDPSQRSKLGKQAQLWTAQNRTWAAAAERYTEVYERLVTAIRA